MEYDYLSLIRKVLDEGEIRTDRTGVGTWSLFGEKLICDLSKGFPLLTTKKMFWKGVKEELLWFMKGNTDAKLLSEKGVHIWDLNTTSSFHKQRRLFDYDEGDCGPIYGFQWRHFNATYNGCKTNYDHQGIDQLTDLIENLIHDPYSRRHILTAWNPCQLEAMVLPPCHVLSQFYVSNDNKLCCQMYQRSADLGLGVPFNIASYALLTHLIAHHCGYDVGKIHYVFGDIHVYNSHHAELLKQLERLPKALPTLKINSQKKKSIDQYTSDEIVLSNYESWPAISLGMAV